MDSTIWWRQRLGTFISSIFQTLLSYTFAAAAGARSASLIHLHISGQPESVGTELRRVLYRESGALG